jgi:formylglycine-generating enzyme required for sulfatase activity
MDVLTQPASQPVEFGSPYGNGVVRLGNGVDLRLALIPAGEFVMGQDSEPDDPPSFPSRHVTLTRPYYMGVYPITQQQCAQVLGLARFVSICGANNLLAEGKLLRVPPQSPVSLPWSEALAFCKRVYRLTGARVRLPTEAEWERACRAGTKTKYFWGDSNKKANDYAWVDENLNARGMFSCPVGQNKPNPWGLYDLYDFPQWCSDYYDPSYYKKVARKNQIDPTGPPSPTGMFRATPEHSLRPGNFEKGPTAGRSSRSENYTGGVGSGAGLRVLVELPLVPPREFTGVFRLRDVKQSKCMDEPSYITDSAAMGNFVGRDDSSIVFGEINPDKPATTGGVKLPPDIASPAKPNDTIKVSTLVQLAIPNKLTAEKLPDPDPDIYKLFKDAKVGALLKVKIRTIPGQKMYDVVSAKPYKLAPGEDKPGVYVFQRTATMTLQKADHPAVVLSKYLEETTLAIMNPQLAAALDRFKSGDSVRVTFEGKMLQSIEAYKP